MKSNENGLDVIVCMFNEQDVIQRYEEDLIPHLNDLNLPYRIIFVNDGSVDDTRISLFEFKKKHPALDIIILEHERNMGLGSALRTAFNTIKYSLLVTLDADLTYSPSQIRFLLSEIEGVDAVFGSPYFQLGLVKGVRLTRLFPSMIVSIFYSLLMRKRLSCWTGMFRLYRKNTISDIKITNDGFDAIAEIAIKIVRQGFTVKEIPAVLRTRREGTSKLRLGRALKRHLRNMARIMSRKY